ncbi:MAG: barstar family protein [Turneriella sp.]
MKKLHIDAAKIRTAAAFYAELDKCVTLPAHFGNNLDALFDFLTTELAGGLEVHWQNFAAYTAEEKKQMNGIRQVLEDAGAERPEIRLVL